MYCKTYRVKCAFEKHDESDIFEAFMKLIKGVEFEDLTDAKINKIKWALEHVEKMIVDARVQLEQAEVNP